MSDELKPCPLCGATPTFALSDVDEYGQAWDRLSCPSCHVYVERALEKDGSGSDVVKRWNTRTTDDRLARAMAMLREARQEIRNSTGWMGPKKAPYQCGLIDRIDALLGEDA